MQGPVGQQSSSGDSGSHVFTATIPGPQIGYNWRDPMRLPAIPLRRLARWSFLLLIVLLLGAPLQVLGQTELVGSACSKYAGNPILVPGASGAWDAQAIGRQSMMYNGTGYNMWYTSEPSLQIGFASSKDGLHWTKYPLPVLTAGPKGSWDQGGVEGPSVVWNGTTFLMYYSGSNGTLASDVGIAFSKDMLHWQKYAGNPVLVRTPNSFDAVSVKYPDVLFNNSSYQMWYTARSATNVGYTLGYATSSDGLLWKKYPDNPVITPNSAGTAAYVAARYSSVVRIGSAYVMAFLLTVPRDDLSYAVSPDGIHWNVSKTILLTNTNSTADWDYTPSYPSLVVLGNTLLLYYSGESNSIPPYPSIGLAYCSLSTNSPTSTSYATSTPSTSSTSTTSTSTSTSSSTSSSSTSSAPSSTTGGGGGGIPEFSFQAIAVGAISLLIAVSYLTIWRNSSSRKAAKPSPSQIISE